MNLTPEQAIEIVSTLLNRTPCNNAEAVGASVAIETLVGLVKKAHELGAKVAELETKLAPPS